MMSMMKLNNLNLNNNIYSLNPLLLSNIFALINNNINFD